MALPAAHDSQTQDSVNSQSITYVVWFIGHSLSEIVHMYKEANIQLGISALQSFPRFVFFFLGWHTTFVSEYKIAQVT